MTNQELQSLKNKYDIIGNDPALNEALVNAVKVAPTDMTVLVIGESGVGKENIPKIIHQNSPRKRAKYFAINCGAIPEGTVDSELFGHEKGAFTGATEMRKGYFEEADGGTLFLDEIAELPLASQAKLLRVLQDGEFIRVGSSKVLKTDVRVIAATNVNLLHAVAKGKFREDLYYRLETVTIKMPALRERPGDINILFRKFASDFSARYGTAKVSLSEDASIMLRKYRWPGNIRQLKNVAEKVSVLESMALSAGGDKCLVNVETLLKYIPREEPDLLPATVQVQEKMDESEKTTIVRMLLQLRQEVDYLKKIIGSMAPQELPQIGNHDTEFQAQREAPEEQELDFEPEEQSAPLSLKSLSAELIEKVLKKHGGNRKGAAKELGISERTLYRKLKK
jgi:transcriptional regulator with PAS, ATPase and Fis domain